MSISYCQLRARERIKKYMYLKIQNSLLRLSHSVADGNCVDFKKYEKKLKHIFIKYAKALHYF